MIAVLRRYLPALVAVPAIAALACDLSHVHDAYRLTQANRDRAARVQPLLAQDLALTSTCAWPKYDQENRGLPGCIAQVLPNLKTGQGLYVGTLMASVWLAQHPEDSTTKALALKSIDRLWDSYRKEDAAMFRTFDTTANDLNRSVLSRAVKDVQEAGADAAWVQKLEQLEVAITDPVLAEKQRKRTMHYAMEDAQAVGHNAGK